jgi:hypothetical protein
MISPHERLKMCQNRVIQTRRMSLGNPRKASFQAFSSGASRTRTGDLLGAIQERRREEPASRASFWPLQQLETPRIPHVLPGGFGDGTLFIPKTAGSS